MTTEPPPEAKEPKASTLDFMQPDSQPVSEEPGEVVDKPSDVVESTDDTANSNVEDDPGQQLAEPVAKKPARGDACPADGCLGKLTELSRYRCRGTRAKESTGEVHIYLTCDICKLPGRDAPIEVAFDAGGRSSGRAI